MPKIAYSEEEREKIRRELVTATLQLIARQGVQHTTVEQIYKTVGISRTFFYTFFATKEDLILETLYFQQPKLLAYAKELMEDPALSWREGVSQFMRSCCHGEKSGIAVLTMEEQRMMFLRLSEDSYRIFRQKQMRLFQGILQCFGVQAERETLQLFVNLSLATMVICKALPESLPLLIPEAVEDTVEFQIKAIVDYLETIRQQNPK